MKKIISFLSAALLSAALALSAAAGKTEAPLHIGLNLEKIQVQLNWGLAYNTVISGGSLPIIIGIAVVAVIVLAVIIIRMKKKKQKE